MSDIESVTFSETAASNNAASPNGAPEGMAPSGVNDTIREVMGALKRDWNRSHTTIASTGSANAYALAYTSAPAAYVNGQQFAFNANFANTGSATANVNGLGAKTIQKQTSAGMANLASGDIQPGQHVILEYDSGLDKLILLTPQFGAGLSLPVSVSNGGTGVGTLGAHGVLMGEGTSSIAASGTGTAGQMFTSNGASADGSYQNISAIQTKTADYTLVQSDQGDTFIMNSASAHTLTLPDNATVGNGWAVRIINQGAGALTVARAGTDTIASGGSTSLAAIQLSQGDAGDITADGVSHGIFWWRGVRHYDSGQKTITSGGALTLPHGLGVQPQQIAVWIHCTTAELGFSVGHEQLMTSGESNAGGADRGASIIADASNLTIRYSSNVNAFGGLNGSNGNSAAFTNANWAAVWRAYVNN